MLLPGPVAFFDGECKVCDWSVRFLMRRDRDSALYYASLQGETAATLRADHPSFPSDIETMVLAEPRPEGIRLHLRSDGILRALQLGGGVPRLAALLRLVPRSLRDLVYRILAANRFRLFGRKGACALPTPAERTRLLP